jgi:hypothetical protein
MDNLAAVQTEWLDEHVRFPVVGGYSTGRVFRVWKNGKLVSIHQDDTGATYVRDLGNIIHIA